MLVCCKLNTRRSVTGSSPEYRLKEKYYLRRISLDDKENIEGKSFKMSLLEIVGPQNGTYYQLITIVIQADPGFFESGGRSCSYGQIAIAIAI